MRTSFFCPKCGNKYKDNDGKYLEKCNRNKKFTTNVNCLCGTKFFMTYNYKGDAVSFL